MNNKNDRPHKRGSGSLTGLFLIFLILKLTGIITWSWALVLAPLWIPWVLALSIIILKKILS